VEFHRLSTPFVVVGCRADLPHQVSPEAVADDCSRVGAGLVLTTTTTEDGVKKMQGAFNWIVKTVLRQRGPANSDTPSKAVACQRLDAGYLSTEQAL
jgi:hypothetical protein